MFSSMRRGLKSIDFYQAVPSQLSEGTVSGACISIGCIGLLVFLICLSIYQFIEPRKGSDLIVDQQHLDQKLKVNIDISFPSFPCSMLSLDIQNILKVHEVNIKQNLVKITLPQNQPYIQSQNRQQRKKRIKQDFNTNKGCRMKGTFQIDRVPGNFHFSCHGYGDIAQQFLNQGSLIHYNKNIDLTHIIHELWFGQNRGKYVQTFREFHSRKQIGDAFLGISYTYFLDIVQSNQYDSARKVSNDNYYYTARMNEVILATFPMVYFKYETNPISMFTYSQYAQWHELFVKVVGIIGGIFTVSTILDSMVHSSIHFLLEKHRLNKLY